MKCSKCNSKMVLYSEDIWVETERGLFGKWFDITYKRKTYVCTECENYEESQIKIRKTPVK